MKSVQRFLGPARGGRDCSTPGMRSDVTDSAKGSGLLVRYLGHQPFSAENIPLVHLPRPDFSCILGTTNSHSRSRRRMCGSNCAISWGALMKVGVHTVVFRGRPERAQMQLVGDIKGSRVLRFDDTPGAARYFLGGKLKDVTNPPYSPRPPLSSRYLMLDIYSMTTSRRRSGSGSPPAA